MREHPTKVCPRCRGSMNKGARTSCMACRGKAVNTIARTYGVDKRKVRRIGAKRLLAMSPEARRLMLRINHPQQLSTEVSSKVGLARQGFIPPASRSTPHDERLLQRD